MTRLSPTTPPQEIVAPQRAGTSAVPAVVVVAVCTVAIGVGSGLGFVYGYLFPVLREDLGISRAAVGALVSVYFGSTGVGSIAGGRLADRLGARLAVAVDLALVTVAAGALAVAGSYPLLLAMSVVAGAAYSLANAGTNVAIGAVVPPARRATALAVKTAGVPALAVVSAFLAPWAGDRFGWRAVMGAVAVLAAACCAAALLVLPPDRPRGRPERAGALPRGFLWFPAATFLMLVGTQPIFSWSVAYFEEALGVRLAVAGVLSAVAAIGGTVGMVLVGLRSDRVGATRRIRLIVLLCAVCAASLAVLTVGVAVGVVVALVALTVAMASQLGAIGLMHAAVVDAVPHAVGRGSGVTMTGYYLGALVSPALFGALVDTTGAYALPWGVGVAALVLAALAFVQLDRTLDRSVEGV